MSEHQDSQATDPNTSLGQYLTPLRDHRRIVVLVTLVVVAVGMLAAVAGPSSYTARTSVLIYPVSPDPTEALQSTGRADDMATELRIADSRAVAEMAATELQALGIEVTPADAKASITISNPEDSRVLHVSYQASDSSVARVGSELTASAYLAYRSELNTASRQVARTSINDEIAVLQDRLATVEGQVDQAAAGSSARLVAEVERTTVEGELAAQQRALADLSTLSIDAATVFDAAQEPTSADGLGAAQILVGALAGGLVLGMLAAWTMAALGIDPNRVSNPRSFSSPTRPGGKTKDHDEDDEPSDADSPFDDSDNRDPLELLRALEAVEADPALTLDKSPAGDPAVAAVEPTEVGADDSTDDATDAGDAVADATASAQTLPPLDSTNFEWTPNSLADASFDADGGFGTEADADTGADGAVGVVDQTDVDQPGADYDPFDPSTLMGFGPSTDDEDGAVDVAAPSPLLAQLKGQGDDPVAADTEAWPTEETPSLGPDELFASIGGVVAPSDPTTDVAAEGFDAFEAPFEAATGDPFATTTEVDAVDAVDDAADANVAFDAEFDPEFDADVAPEILPDEDTAEPSLSSGDPRELDPGPPSWEGPFIGPTTWEQLSAMAAATPQTPDASSADADEFGDAEAPAVATSLELVASNDVDGLFEQLSRLGAAGPVSVLSLSDRDPAAGLTAGFELADELRAVGANVLLIDVRLENPVLDTLFDDGPGAGVAQVMTGQVVLAEAVRNLPGLEGLDLLTVGTTDAETATHLSGAPFQRLLSEARLSYHSIVVIGDAIVPAQSGQAVDVDRARALSAAVDALIVGTTDPAGTPAGDELLATLGSFDAPTLQLVTAPAAAAANESAHEASSV